VTALVLDAGAFVAWERGSVPIRAYIEAARRLGVPVESPSPVVAQIWRDGAKQARVSSLLRGVDVVAPNLAIAKVAGTLCRMTSTTDVVDAIVVACAGQLDSILTSDVGDISKLVAVSGRRIDVVPV
jgi:hypothetical protein